MTPRKPKELLKIHPYHISSQRLLQLWKRYDHGVSARQLSKEIGIPGYVILQHFRVAGYKVRTQKEAYRLVQLAGKVGGSHGCGERSNGWKGGRRIDAFGYIHVCKKNGHGYEWEHRRVWEQYHKKTIPKGWHIHHINGNKSDNRIENLLALSSREHSLIIAKLSQRIGKLEAEIRRLKEK